MGVLVELSSAHDFGVVVRIEQNQPAVGAVAEIQGLYGPFSFPEKLLQKIWLRRRAFAGRVSALFETIDLLLIPAQSSASPTKLQMDTLGVDPEGFARLVKFAAPFSMSGGPTLTLRGGFTPQGTPVAIQLAAAHLNEAMLVRAGRAFQRETDWHRRHPKLNV